MSLRSPPLESLSLILSPFAYFVKAFLPPSHDIMIEIFLSRKQFSWGRKILRSLQGSTKNRSNVLRRESYLLWLRYEKFIQFLASFVKVLGDEAREKIDWFYAVVMRWMEKVSEARMRTLAINSKQKYFPMNTADALSRRLNFRFYVPFCECNKAFNHRAELHKQQCTAGRITLAMPYSLLCSECQRDFNSKSRWHQNGTESEQVTTNFAFFCFISQSSWCLWNKFKLL